MSNNRAINEGYVFDDRRIIKGGVACGYSDVYSTLTPVNVEPPAPRPIPKETNRVSNGEGNNNG